MNDLTPLETVKWLLVLMRTSSLPSIEWEPDAIVPHSNGYSMWFVGAEQFVEGLPTGTKPLTAEAILARIEARREREAGGSA